ncbi:MAG: insulinase family protein [Clostridia bacterium]|nr:insulinase family protein [Clostridia bacterium]
MNNRFFENIRESLYTETLENGLTIHIMPQPGFMRSFAMFATNYGGAMRRFELEGKIMDTPAGVAHFLEHKMFDLPDGTNALSLLSANGASPNAWTSNGMTAYHFSSTQGFEQNLRTLLTFVSTPYFTPESVAKEQGIIGQEIRMTEDSPGFSVYVNLMRSLYEHNPIRDSVIGTVESISHISDRTLYDCHKAFYAPSNMVLCIAGGSDPDSTVSIARDILPKDAAPVPKPDFGPEEGPLPKSARIERAMEVSAPQFLLGSKLKPAENGEALLRQKLTGALALRCLMGRSSAFYTGLYAEGLLKNDFASEMDYAAGTAAVIAGGESADPEKVLSRLSAAVVKISENGIDNAVFDRAKRAAYGAKLRELESFEELCFSAAQGHFGGYCPLDAFSMLPDIGADDCAAFITENLPPEHLALSVVTPANTKG